MPDGPSAPIAPPEILALAGRGWPVFPVKGKRPLTPHGFKDGSTDPAQIEAWDQEYPGCGWGVDCGRAGLVVIDLDPRNGGDERFDQIRETAGWPLIETATALTGGGGHHLFFRANGREVRCGKLADGVDVKATGGYVVLPPSPHPSGGRYEWILDPAEVGIEELPGWLAELLEQMPVSQAAPQLSGQIHSGERNASLTSLAGSMRRRGMSHGAIEAALLAENATRCDPPLPPDEVQAIAASVARYQPAIAAGVVPPPPKRQISKDFLIALTALGWDFRLNEADDSISVNDAPMSDAIRALIRTQLRDAGYGPLEAAEDAWVAHAGQHSFHPVRDFLLGLSWDGQDHIANLASYFQDQHGVLPMYLRRFLVGAVARVLKGGAQNRMLILDAMQGKGKSFFVRWLASPLPSYYTEAPILPDDKDSALRLIGSWLWEVAEFGSTTRRADRESLKFFISQETVTVRRPYGRFDIRKPALASFIATINNESGFLADPTGSRRYMTTTLTGIDWAYTDSIRPEDVWAHAVALFKAGEPWNLTADEAQQAASINELYAVGDPVEDAIYRIFELEPHDGSSFMTTAEVLRSVALEVTGLNSDALVRRAGAVLTKAGLRQERRRTSDGQVRGWVGAHRRLP